MPAQQLQSAANVAAAKYAIVGTYAAGSGNVVGHVALVREDDVTLSGGTTVRVWEMRPPLVAGNLSSANTGIDATCAAQVIGWIEFTAEERAGITDWLAEVDKQQRPLGGPMVAWRQYTVSLNPDDQWQKDERGVRVYRRFNCASFVLTAYMEGAGVSILNTDPSLIPEVDVEILASAYGDHARVEGLRRRIGLGQTGRWRVVLAGYVLNALNRPDLSIRSTAHTVTGPHEREFPPTVSSESQAAS